MASSGNNDSTSTYPVLPGTVDKGRHYEVVFTASVVLELVLDGNIKDFWISSNNSNFVPFDDVVVEIETVKGIKEGFAIQLKHGNRAISTNHLTGKKGDFSIKKYFEDIKNPKGNDKKCFEGFKFILFTNRNGKTIDKRFQLEGEGFDINKLSCDAEKLFKNFCPKNDASYRFEVNNEEYSGFLKKIFLYVNQLDVEQMEKKLSDRFQREFDCEESIFTEYLKFITKWSQDNKTKKEKLNKTWMKEIIATRLLSPFVRPISFDSPNNNTKIDIFRRSINNFDITVFEEKNFNTVAEFWSASEEFKNIGIKDVNKVNNYYQIVQDYIKNISDLTTKHQAMNNINGKLKNMTETSMLLWLLDKCPLIVKYHECIRKAIQFLKQKKIIVLCEDCTWINVKNSLGKFQIFQNLANLEENVSLYEELVQTFHCSLQGKPKISLKTLIGANHRFEEQITTNDLLLFLNDDFMIGEKEILPDIYIERYFSRHIINYKFLSEVDKDTVIVISNFNTSNKHLKQFQMEDIEILLQKDLKKEEYENRKIFCFCRNNCSQEKFEVICGKKKYHHFSIFEEKLEWICSRGGIQDLKKYQNQEKPVEDKVLYVSDNNIMILCGDPGLGKTTSMKYLKNSTYPSFWTFLIYPKDHSKYFRENQADVDGFMKYLLGVSDQTSQKFDSKVLQNLLDIGRVNFIWDGLDEISDKNLNVVLAIIKEISKKCLKQCITSRNNLRNRLESGFSAIATTIRQFNEEEQKLYLTKRLSNSEEELESIFARIRNNINLFKDNHILSIPLQIYMFTTLFIQDSQKYNELLTNTFSINDLYYHFIIQKFNIYFQEKENACDTNDNTEKKNKEYRNYRIKSYQHVALQMYFSEEGVSCFDYNECEEFLTDLRENKDSIGIITGVSSDNLPNFIHNSYGEYFAASYLSKNYKYIPNLRQFLFKEKFKNIRFLFDLILAKDCPAHIAVLCKNLEALKDCKIDSLTKEDQGGRHPLQLACSYGESYPLLTVTEEIHPSLGKRYIVHEEREIRVKKPNLKYENIVRYLSDICNLEHTDKIYKLRSAIHSFTSITSIPFGNEISSGF